MIVCVVPAAGESSRFPWNKLLFIYNEKPIIVQTISNILGSGVVDDVVLVTGYQSSSIVELTRRYGLNVRVVYNQDYKSGMSSSIKLGVKYVTEAFKNVHGVMVNPGDAAWIHPGIYTLLVVKFLEYMDRYDIVVATYRGRRGHPIIFSGRLLSELESVSEETQGLREVVKKHSQSTLLVETGYPGVVLDLDTVLDILRVKSSLYV